MNAAAEHGPAVHRLESGRWRTGLVVSVQYQISWAGGWSLGFRHWAGQTRHLKALKVSSVKCEVAFVSISRYDGSVPLLVQVPGRVEALCRSDELQVLQYHRIINFPTSFTQPGSKQISSIRVFCEVEPRIITIVRSFISPVALQ